MNRLSLLLLPPLLVGCVSMKKHNSVVTELQDTRAALASAETEAQDQAMQKEILAEATAELRADKAELIDAVQRLRAQRAASDARNEELAILVARFEDMVDAGTLKVKVVDNRMVLEVGSDILFPSGSAELSDEGATTALRIGNLLSEATSRPLQVEGHTDDQKIVGGPYADNWELGAARAMAVAGQLRAAGVPAEQVSVASYAHTHPVASNDSERGRALNRRIEIALQPDLELLPALEPLAAR